MLLRADLWLHGRNVRGMKEQRAGEDTGRQDGVAGPHCCLFKVSEELNWAQLNAVAGSSLHTHWFLFFFFTQLAFLKEERQWFCLLGKWLHSLCALIKTCYASADPDIPSVMGPLGGSNGFWQMVLLNKGIKAKDTAPIRWSLTTTVPLFNVFIYNYLVIYHFGPFKYTKPCRCLSLRWKW